MESTLKSDESKLTTTNSGQLLKPPETEYTSKMNILVSKDYDDIDEEPMSATKVKVKIKTTESLKKIEQCESPKLKEK